MNLIKRIVAGKVIKSILEALTADHKTTVVGVLGAALLTADLDYGKLLEGDPGAITKAVTAVVLAGIGYFTNKGVKVDGKVQEVREEKE